MHKENKKNVINLNENVNKNRIKDQLQGTLGRLGKTMSKMLNILSKSIEFNRTLCWRLLDGYLSGRSFS